jgi:NhaP-type Na+/H+ or K+/H+ antiporter
VAIETVPGALSPVIAIALVGGLGVGSQWLAWRLRMPAIVLMLLAGVIIGPVLGVFDPARDIGPLMAPIIAIAVAIILFEGGLTLNFHQLLDAAVGVRRLVFIGGPLGWVLSTLTLHYGAGLTWSSSWVFGGILIVTGPTVIAPLLRTARLSRRPSQLLQWEAIVNDPIGAMAAVLAFEVVLVLNTAETIGGAIWELGLGIGFALGLGLAAGYGLAASFRRGWVPEYMKVSILFALLLGIFGISDAVLHESGLLAVTVMGIVIANANLPSYEELRRFKEHATILLVSGVFILLAANLDFVALELLTWRSVIFVGMIIFVARPVTVFASLWGSGIPRCAGSCGGSVCRASAGARVRGCGANWSAGLCAGGSDRCAARLYLEALCAVSGVDGCGQSRRADHWRVHLDDRAGRGAGQSRGACPNDRSQLWPPSRGAGGGDRDLFWRHLVRGGRAAA